MTADRHRKSDVIRARCDSTLKSGVAAFAARVGLEEADIVRMAVVDYLAKLPADIADGLEKVVRLTPDEARQCLAEINRGLAHVGKPGTMGVIAASAAHLAGIVNDDLERVAQGDAP